jgi:TonB family protein
LQWYVIFDPKLFSEPVNIKYIKSRMIVGALMISTAVGAQKITTYFPNGNKSFEGEYTLVYPQPDVRDLYNFDTAADPRKASVVGMAMRGMERESLPQKQYNGKCSFYYDNGKLSFSGDYRNGVKNGQFSYFYFAGTKEAEYTFVNGMADGKWTTWYADGKQRSEQHYTAYAAAILDSLVASRSSGIRSRPGVGDVTQRKNLRTFAKDTMNKLPANGLSKFSSVENGFFRNSCWNGTFSTWYENGKKCTEMQYKDNVRIGKWYYWDVSGKVNVELTFADGKIADIVNNLPPEPERTAPVGMRAAGVQRSQGGNNHLSDSMKAVMDKRMAMSKLPHPDVQPKPSTDAQKYIREHMAYPEAARQNKVAGAVMVRFVVNEDGTTSDFDVVRGLGSGCDEEAVKVIKSMPPWTPGMKDGKPVRSVFMLPVTFMSETPAKSAK